MGASRNGHHDIVRTLLENGADLNAKTNVRDQMMMMMMLIIVLTILMMMMMMMKIIIYDEDRGVCR